MTSKPRRRLSGVLALVVLITTLGVVGTAAPAIAQRSTVTQEDCDQGRIRDRQGNVIRGERCERLIGQRVNLADTGFEAWLIALGGFALIGGAALVRVRRPARRLL